jgi:hypothetical protein
MFTVKYDKSGSSGGKTEAGIQYSHVTETPSPFGSTKSVRERRAPETFDNVLPQTPMTPQLTRIQEILAAGAARGRNKGWRAKDLEVAEHGSRNENFQNLLCEDTKKLMGFLSGKSSAAPASSSTTRHDKRGRNGRFSKRNNKNNPHTITYLAKAWGVSKNFPLLNLKKRAALGLLSSNVSDGDETKNKTNEAGHH